MYIYIYIHTTVVPKEIDPSNTCSVLGKRSCVHNVCVCVNEKSAYTRLQSTSVYLATQSECVEI